MKLIKTIEIVFQSLFTLSNIVYCAETVFKILFILLTTNDTFYVTKFERNSDTEL